MQSSLKLVDCVIEVHDARISFHAVGERAPLLGCGGSRKLCCSLRLPWTIYSVLPQVQLYVYSCRQLLL